MAYLTLSRPLWNFSLSPPDVMMLIPPRIIQSTERKMAIIRIRSIKTPIALIPVPALPYLSKSPPEGTPEGGSI